MTPLTPDISVANLRELMYTEIGPVGHVHIRGGQGFVVFIRPDGWKAFDHCRFISFSNPLILSNNMPSNKELFLFIKWLAEKADMVCVIVARLWDER